VLASQRRRKRRSPAGTRISGDRFVAEAITTGAPADGESDRGVGRRLDAREAETACQEVCR